MIDKINEDTLVIIGLFGNIPDIPGFTSHACICYGYCNEELILHYGQSTYESAVRVNISYVSEAFSCSFNTGHIHSNNYEWIIGDFTGMLCFCGYKQCDHNEKEILNYDDINHILRCLLCGNNQYQQHDFVYLSQENKCRICGYSIEHNHVHSYSYLPLNNGSHKAICNCGNKKIELCIGFGSFDEPSNCIKCGSNMSISLYLEDIKEK